MAILTLVRVIAILDSSTDIYLSEWYKSTKKNEEAMKKEIDRLNGGKEWKYVLHYTMMNKKWMMQTFDPKNY